MLKLGIAAVLGLSEFAVGDTWPDLNVLLDVPVEVGLGRINGPPDRLEQQGDGFHARVRETFLMLAAATPDQWLVIDGTQPVDTVTAELDAALNERFLWML